MKIPVVPEGSGTGIPERLRSHKSGGRDLWSAPQPVRPDEPEEGVLDCLGEVLDPELPVSLVDLGLIYGVTVEGTEVRVEVTFTATACPCMEFIKEDIRDRLTREPWIETVRIREVWDPPWTTERITPEGREALRRVGVGA